jgi:hypothetical protein
VYASGTYGHSWWVFVLPFLEQNAAAEKFDRFGAAYGGSTGWLGANAANRTLFDGVAFSFMLCPSSTLPRFAEVPSGSTHRIAASMYAGISGAKDHSTAVSVSDSGTKGYRARGGTLILNQAVYAALIRDGASNTLMVGEQSDWCRDPATGQQKHCAANCRHGFPMGPDRSTSRQFQVTTVMHPLNARSNALLGVLGDLGQCQANTPLQSAHPGGVQVAAADGSAHFLAEQMEVQLLYDLANRDDGHYAQIK